MMINEVPIHIRAHLALFSIPCANRADNLATHFNWLNNLFNIINTLLDRLRGCDFFDSRWLHIKRVRQRVADSKSELSEVNFLKFLIDFWNPSAPLSTLTQNPLIYFWESQHTAITFKSELVIDSKNKPITQVPKILHVEMKIKA